ncbi:MAG: hypothetical protein K6E50_04960 [Lachnospiraceae bacterium]|nr:hypothetical protein [Lachnospiraceae bacterium]
MALSDKLHKKSEDDYVLYDETDERVRQSTYHHWYEGKKYLLIWEKKYDPREVPRVYLNPDSPLEYVAIADENLVEAIADDFWKQVSAPLQTDGPFWSYQQGSMVTGYNAMPAEWICPGCKTKNTGKFCTECGAKKAESGGQSS